MSTFLSFTRGGQLHFHSLHMFWQVLVRFLKIAIIIFILLTAALWATKTSKYEWYLLAQTAKAFCCQGNAFCPTKIAHIGPHGQHYQLTAKQLLSSPALLRQQ